MPASPAVWVAWSFARYIEDDYAIWDTPLEALETLVGHNPWPRNRATSVKRPRGTFERYDDDFRASAASVGPVLVPVEEIDWDLPRHPLTELVWAEMKLRLQRTSPELFEPLRRATAETIAMLRTPAPGLRHPALLPVSLTDVYPVDVDDEWLADEF